MDNAQEEPELTGTEAITQIEYFVENPLLKLTNFDESTTKSYKYKITFYN